MWPLADVARIERHAVVFHRPQPPGQLVGQRAGGLVVAPGVLDLQRPGLQRIEGLSAALLHPRRLQYRAGAVDQQRSHVDIAALGQASQSALPTRGMLARGQAQPRENWRALRKRDRSPALARSAVAVSRPTPGTLR